MVERARPSVVAAAADTGPGGSSLSRLTRPLAVAGWAVIALVMIRIAWGGGPGGIQYVLDVEPTLAILVGAVVVLMAIGLGLWLLVDGSARAFRASAIGAALTLAFGLFAVRDGHDSGAVMIAVAIALMAISLRVETTSPASSSAEE